MTYSTVSNIAAILVSWIAYDKADDNSFEGGGSSEEEQEAALPEITSQCAEDKELKSHLLNKYSGYLSSLWRDLSKKKKKGKLPRDARQKLLHWWQLHYRWPYPSVRLYACRLGRRPYSSQLGACNNRSEERRVGKECLL